MHRALTGLAGLLFVASTAAGAGLFPDAPGGVLFNRHIDTVRLADIDGDGALDLVGIHSWAGIEVALGAPDGSFGAPIPVTLDGFLSGFVWRDVVDFNGDGRADVLLLTDETPRRLHVFLAEPDLSFSLLHAYPIDVDWLGADLFVTDLDGDGDADVAVIEDSGLFRPFINVVGFLNPGTTTYVFEEVDGGVAMQDVTGDALPDVLVRRLGDLSLFLGTESGTLGGPVASAGIAERPFDAADLDGDGIPDLATTSLDGFVVHPGLGGGAFGSGVAVLTGEFEEWVRLVDVTLDGVPDLVGDDEVFENDGAGSFGSRTPMEMLAPTFTDLDEDGLPENLALGNPVLIATGISGGILLPATVYGVGANHAVIDLDLDGRDDLVTVHDDPDTDVPNQLWIARGRADREVEAEHILTAPFSLETHAFGQLDGDEIPDLVVLTGDSSDRVLVVAPGTGDGSFDFDAGYPPLPVAGGQLLRPRDLNGDGHDDVISPAGAPFPPGLTVVLSDGSGGWASSTFYPMSELGTNGVGGLLQDVNGDGHVDLVVEDRARPGLGDGTFGPPVSFDLPGDAHVIALADLDHDGDLDCLHSEAFPESPARVTLYEQTSAWTFEDVASWTIQWGPARVADVDVDGHPDILVENLVIRGHGDLTFDDPVVTWGSGAGPAGDLDGDGAPDLVVPGYPSRVLWNDTSVVAVGEPVAVAPSGWLRAVGTPFRTGVRIEAAPGTTSLAIVDVTGRSLRTWSPANATTTSTSWTWDGRDADGRAVAAGVYFVTAPGADAVRLVRVR